MDATTTNPVTAPSPAVTELSEWKLKNSDSRFDDAKYLEGMDAFSTEFNDAFAGVVEMI